MNFKTTQKAIFLISLSIIGYIVQLHYKTKGFDTYNTIMGLYTINPNSGLEALITSTVMHANLIHLGMNMLMLYLLSTMFIQYKSKFITVYLISGLLSGIFSIIYVTYINPAFVLGASGAIFGIFAYIFFKTDRIKEFFINFIVFNVGMVAVGMNIAWYSHLGGAIAGILYFYFENDIMPNIRRKKLKRIS